MELWSLLIACSNLFEVAVPYSKEGVLFWEWHGLCFTDAILFAWEDRPWLIVFSSFHDDSWLWLSSRSSPWISSILEISSKSFSTFLNSKRSEDTFCLWISCTFVISVKMESYESWSVKSLTHPLKSLSFPSALVWWSNSSWRPWKSMTVYFLSNCLSSSFSRFSIDYLRMPSEFANCSFMSVLYCLWYSKSFLASLRAYWSSLFSSLTDLPKSFCSWAIFPSLCLF